MDLFNTEPVNEPLAYRMSPGTSTEYAGQEHIIGEGKLLRRALEADRITTSLILYGPPGTGKTALAKVIAEKTMAHFEWLCTGYRPDWMNSERSSRRQGYEKQSAHDSVSR